MNNTHIQECNSEITFSIKTNILSTEGSPKDNVDLAKWILEKEAELKKMYPKYVIDVTYNYRRYS